MVLAKIFNTLARLIGWSPVGKPVLLRIDDASEATLKNRQFAGKLVILYQDGTAMIEPETPIALKDGTIAHVLAVPRHQGYNFYYLCWGFIAVYLINPNVVHGAANEQTGARFAVASLKIAKSMKVSKSETTGTFLNN